MEVLILGTGGMMPMPGRFLASAVLRHHGRATLFDCGEGTQIPLKSSGFGVSRFDRIALTHRHADHVTGLPGMLMLIAQAGPRPPLDVAALPEVCDYVRGTCRLLAFHMEYDLRYRELDPKGGSFRGEGFTLTYRPLAHRVPNLGFRYEEDPRPGRFDAARAEALGIPEGPDRSALLRGETVVVNGKPVSPDAVVGPPRRGRRFAYVVDTIPCDAAVELLDGCDVAVIEAMFREQHVEEAAAKMHLTARQAARLVRQAGVKRALLTHFSPRYDAQEIAGLEAEAREVAGETEAARPLARYPVAAAG